MAQAEGRKVEAQLIAPVTALEPGAALRVGLLFDIVPHWHTYWLNPGDSGIPTTIRWDLPPGFVAGPLEFPYPQRYPVGPLVNFGYGDQVLHLATIEVPADLVPGTEVTLNAHAEWLVCEEICIPEESALSLTLPVGTGPAPADPSSALLFAETETRLPQPAPWPIRHAADERSVTLAADDTGLTAESLTSALWFPLTDGIIVNAAPQEVTVEGGRLRLTVARGGTPPSERLDGLLVITETSSGGPVTRAFTVDAPRGTVTPAAAGSSGAAGGGTAGAGLSGLLLALAGAFAGGVMLNLMPCVFPVLSMKALSLVRLGDRGGMGALGHGLSYTGGVLVSFLVLAGGLLLLRAGGEQIGWGFQLQSPAFVAGTAWLIFALGLSLSGVLVIGTGLMGLGAGLAAREGHAGSFFTGMLATIVATPCTAPFMGAALGYALTQPWWAALLIFQMLGLGLALPYLLLTASPALIRRLPRPGPWMERLKQGLAFPMYLTAAWLVWVLMQQAGPNEVGWVLAGFVAIAFGSWLAQLGWEGGLRLRLAGAAVAVLVVAFLLGTLGLLATAPAEAAGTPTGPARAGAGPVPEAFSTARLAELAGGDRPIFVNFTAAWCITCQWNEQAALSSPEMAEAFTAARVVYIKGDWTRRDPEITRVLEQHGRAGVPLYLMYRPGAAGSPEILPQILTPAIMRAALARATSG